MPTPGTILFRDVWKRYEIIQRATPRLGAWILSKALEHFRREPFEALRGLSFDVRPGEMVGIVGSNGAGKSTILKLIAGISQPTSGTVEVGGRVASLLELGVGFHPDLTGIENIFYGGIVMGMSRAEILERLDRIVAFSGLAEFLFEPVKHYSSGMYSRLACSLALHVDPDVLLVDEILAVGDAEFQARGIMRILELNDRGLTVLLVTHETATARDVCHRLLWVEHGRLVEEGDPTAVSNRYLRSMLMRGQSGEARAEDGGAGGRVTGIRVYTGGRESDVVTTGDEVCLDVEVESAGPAARVELLLRWTDGRVLMRDVSPTAEMVDGRAMVRYRVPRWPLLAAEIEVEARLLPGTEGGRGAPGAVLVRRLRVESPGCPVPETLVMPKVQWRVESGAAIDTSGDGHGAR